MPFISKALRCFITNQRPQLTRLTLIIVFHLFITQLFINLYLAFCSLPSKCSYLFGIPIRDQSANYSMNEQFLLWIVLTVQSLAFDYLSTTVNPKSQLQGLKYFQLFIFKPVFTVVKCYFFSTVQSISPFFFSLSQIQVFFFLIPSLFVQMLEVIDQVEDSFALKRTISFLIFLETIKVSGHSFQVCSYKLHSQQLLFYILTSLICYQIEPIYLLAKFDEELEALLQLQPQQQLEYLDLVNSAIARYLFNQAPQLTVVKHAIQAIDLEPLVFILIPVPPFGSLDILYYLKAGFKVAIFKQVLQFILLPLEATILYSAFDYPPILSLHQCISFTLFQFLQPTPFNFAHLQFFPTPCRFYLAIQVIKYCLNLILALIFFTHQFVIPHLQVFDCFISPLIRFHLAATPSIPSINISIQLIYENDQHKTKLSYIFYKP